MIPSELLNTAFSFFKVAFVVTGALFAMAQYFETKHASRIKETKDKLKDFTFCKSHADKLNSSHAQEFKKEWEKHLNKDPKINKHIIPYLLRIILVYAILVPIAMILYVILPWFDNDSLCNTITRIFPILLSLPAIFLLYIIPQLYFYHTMMEADKSDSEAFIKQAAITNDLCKALKPSEATVASPPQID